MLQFFRFLRLNFRRIIRAFYFVISIVIIVIFLPREGKFKYEFQKGKPWMHEDLVAPFDFPIYKSEAELFAERNGILKKFKPIFDIDTSVSARAVDSFLSDFKNAWKNKNLQGEPNQLYLKKVETLLKVIYDKGIIETSVLTELGLDSESSITIIINSLAYDTQLKYIFSVNQAAEQLSSQIQLLSSEQAEEENNIMLHSLSLKKYISSNLTYNKLTSAKMKTELLTSLSITKGLVQTGDRIINKGEVVSNDSFSILESLRREYETKMGFSSKSGTIILGQALIVTILFLVLYLFMLNFRREILEDDLKTIFILLLVTTMAILSSVILKRNSISIYIIPFAIVPIFIKTFYDSRLALFIHHVTIFLVGFFVPNSFEFVFISFIAGVVAIISLSNFYRRGKLFLSVSLVLITYWIVFVGITLIQEGSILALNPLSLLWFAGNALLILASYQLIYVFEKLFGFISDATLMELSDTNQDLLRKLAEVAPGTFQHSLQVANLAEAAALRIGANPLIVRTGALYHDIGKMNNPFYFIENQSPEFNPHKSIDFEESARIIIKHVNDGVALAKKHRLPQQIIDFIVTHHGTSKVMYFYRLFKDKYPDAQHELDKFSYPGPKPNSRETALLMMADSIEAASRALKTYTHINIENMVDTIINHQQIEEQFNDANITFQDLTALKMIFKKKLLNIYHVRIEYPKDDEIPENNLQ